MFWDFPTTKFATDFMIILYLCTPLDCTGLHMKNAQWHYTDENGNALDVNGNCHKGKKHGNFEFLIAGKQVAVTKFINDEENKTSCKAGGDKTRETLAQCLAKAAQNK